MTTFASRLRKARLDAGLAQRELARQVGIDVSQISRYEKGAGEPRPGTLRGLAEALHCSAEWLATGNPDFDPSQMKHRVAVRLEKEDEERVRAIAEETGRTTQDVVKLLILRGLSLLEDQPSAFDMVKAKPRSSRKSSK